MQPGQDGDRRRGEGVPPLGRERRVRDRRATTSSLLRFRRRTDAPLGAPQADALAHRWALQRRAAPAPPALRAVPEPRTGEPCPECGDRVPEGWLVRHLAVSHPSWRG